MCSGSRNVEATVALNLLLLWDRNPKLYSERIREVFLKKQQKKIEIFLRKWYTSHYPKQERPKKYVYLFWLIWMQFMACLSINGTSQGDKYLSCFFASRIWRSWGSPVTALICVSEYVAVLLLLICCYFFYGHWLLGKCSHNVKFSYFHSSNLH